MTGALALSPRDRRTLIGGALGMALIIVGSRVLPRWREWDQQARGSAAVLTTEVASLQAQLRLLPALRDSARIHTARARAVRERLIEAPTVGAAGAALATRVSDIADDLGIKVSAVQIRPDTLFRSGYARVAVTLTAAGDVTHLSDLLETIEISDARLAVRELTVTPADVLVTDERPETLRFQVLVEALAVKSPDSTSVDSTTSRRRASRPGAT
ncbi:MAG TPA: GspMb/PilO family protein [Gemmatimonadaceae bacterium]